MPKRISIKGSGDPLFGRKPPTPLSALPPWDQATYYSVPTESSVAMNNNVVQLLKGDPLRSHIQFGVIANGATAMSGPLVLVSLKQNVTAVLGYGLFDGSFPWLLSFDDYGPLVQQAWFAISNTGNVPPFPIVTVQEMRFIRWPGRLGDPTILQTVDDECDNDAGCADRDSVVRRINGNSGIQHAADSDSDIRAIIESCQRGHKPSCDRYVRLVPNSGGIPPRSG